jgi:hypothetical protein
MRDGQVTEISWKQLCPMKVCIEIISTVDVQRGEVGTAERLFIMDCRGTHVVEGGRSPSVILHAFQLQNEEIFRSAVEIGRERRERGAELNAENDIATTPNVRTDDLHDGHDMFPFSLAGHSGPCISCYDQFIENQVVGPGEHRSDQRHRKG